MDDWQVLLDPPMSALVWLGYKSDYKKYEVLFYHARVSSHPTGITVQARGLIVDPPEWGAKRARSYWFQFEGKGWYPFNQAQGVPEWVQIIGEEYRRELDNQPSRV